MANQKEIEEAYDYMDELFRESLGDHADYSNALYNGNFSLTLKEAQQAKHEYILKSLNFKKGDKILDIGSGWGPMLKEVKDRGGIEVGLSLSPAQVRACQAHGLNEILKDWKDVDPKEFGIFDGIISMGSFEHYCSVKEFQAGKQDEVYDKFFKLCYDLLKPGGRLFLQTMMWGKSVPKVEDLDVHAPKLSDNWVLGHLSKFYPGSWLPNGLDHIVKCANPYFKLISENNGRLDYIQTSNAGGKIVSEFSFKKLFLMLKLVPKYLTDKDFRYQITSYRYSCNRLAFERSLFDHQRMVFEKK